MIKRFFCVALSLIIVFSLSACKKSKTNDEPINLKLWHVYGAQTDSPLNELVDEFNQTVGKEKGIKVNVTMVSNNNTIHKEVISSANGDPGSAEMPDMFISYPKTIFALPDKEILVDFNDYFSKEELSEYVPEFLEEGQIDGKQLIFPVSKSTEVFFLNKTLFDRYALETGAKISDLQTWEGIFKTACDYAKWTDAKTPNIKNDAKSFFTHDFHFNFFQVGTHSLGESFFDGDKIAFGENFNKIWGPYAKAAIEGGIWLKEGYATEPLRTADTISSVASSASVLYFSDIVTYPNNISENVEIITMPCPIFEGGKKEVIQRGAGMCLVKSTKEKELAGAQFLKWLTEENCNSRFAVETGYMPVKTKAFGKPLKTAVSALKDPKYISLYKTYGETYNDYKFYVPPKLESYLPIETAFEENVRLCLADARERYRKGEDIDILIKDSLNSLKNSLN